MFKARGRATPGTRWSGVAPCRDRRPGPRGARQRSVAPASAMLRSRAVTSASVPITATSVGVVPSPPRASTRWYVGMLRYGVKRRAASSRPAAVSSQTPMGSPTTTAARSARGTAALVMLGHDVLAQRPLVGPVGDGAVGELTRELQHLGCERGDHDRRRRRVRHFQHRVHVVELAVIVDAAGALERGAQHLHVLTHMARRSIERQPEHPFDHHRVRRPDAEHQATTGGRLGGQRLLGHGEGMARVGGDDRGAELDAVGDLAGEREGGEAVVTPWDVGHPAGGEAELLGLGGVGQQSSIPVRRATDLADEDSDAHRGQLRTAPSRSAFRQAWRRSAYCATTDLPAERAARD